MASSLEDFLQDLTPTATDAADWGDIYLNIHLYLTPRMPDRRDLITSVRGIIFKGNEVLVLQDTDTTYHLLPGGQIESGESYESALRRELLEETGWTIKDPTYLGFAHLRHATPKPPQYPYPYPDFFHLMYAAHADEYHPTEKVEEEYVVDSRFMRFEHAKSILGRKSQSILLDEVWQQINP